MNPFSFPRYNRVVLVLAVFILLICIGVFGGIYSLLVTNPAPSNLSLGASNTPPSTGTLEPPTALPTFTLQPTAALDWQTRITDTFESTPTRGNWELPDYKTDRLEARYSVEDGHLVIAATSKQDFFQWSVPQTLPVSTFDIEVSVREVSGEPEATIALGYRMVDQDNLHALLLKPDGTYSVVVKERGSWQRLTNWERAPGWKPGEFTKLRAAGEGPYFAFWINGEKVREIRDTHYPSGRIG